MVYAPPPPPGAAPPPDGGWGWVVVFASFIVHLTVLGAQ
jgi:MFS transporter, MCT family, solute carrier family 16 (monocarboxylic acid transporters), member 14